MAKEDWVETDKVLQAGDEPPIWWGGTDEGWRELQARVATRDARDRTRRLQRGSDVRSRGVPGAVAVERRAELEREAEASANAWIAGVIREADQAEERDERARLARTGAARSGYNPRAVAPPSEMRGSNVKVGDEIAPYGPGSSFSYFRDRYLDAVAGWSTGLPRSGDAISEVRRRLALNQRQMSWLATHGTNEERALFRSYFTELNRPSHDTVSDRSREDFRHFIFETRDSSTASNSLGPFVPPIFILELFQLFRTAVSPVAAQAGQGEMPATGMTVNVPLFSSTVSMGTQSSENSNIASSSPTATYAVLDVETLAGAVEVSQQYLDRIGPGVTGDQVIAKQAARQAATVLDQLAITAALAGDNVITNSASPSIAALFADVGKAGATISTTEGTRLQATHVMMPGANVKWFQSQLDSEGRPIWSPSPAATLGRVGQVNSRSEGYTGFDIAGAMVFEDENLPTTNSGSDASILVGDLPNGLLVLSGVPIVDVHPEFQPASLTAIITIRSYVAAVALYPEAFYQLTGAAYPAAPTFTGS